jgi:hypothetical protein
MTDYKLLLKRASEISGGIKSYGLLLRGDHGPANDIGKDILTLIKLARKQIKHEIACAKFGNLVPTDFSSIKESKTSGWENDYRFTYLIVPSECSGHQDRYHVLVLDQHNATINVLGNEIDLPLARKIVKKATANCKYK